MIKLICPKCESDKINLKGETKSINNEDLFVCECGHKFEFRCFMAGGIV